MFFFYRENCYVFLSPIKTLLPQIKIVELFYSNLDFIRFAPPMDGTVVQLKAFSKKSKYPREKMY